MPRAEITGEYRSDAGRSNFPKLKLQTNEHARGVIVSQPIIEYVHWLEAPNIVNMAPTYKKIKDRDGQDRYVVDTRFVARPICSGKFETLRERGVDDRSCQACNMARERPDIFRAPSPRYAVNFLRYNLRPGGSWNDIANPFGVSALIWVFGPKVMDKLIDIRSMGEAYSDIRMVDLLLTCDDQNFQKPYSNGEFLPVAPAVWMANEATRKYTADYLAQNGASDEDLADAIGRRVKEDWLADDISRVIQRWDVVRAYEARQQGAPQMGQGFGMESVQQGLQNVQQQYGMQPGYGQQPQFGAPGTGAPPVSGADPGMLQQPAAASSGIDMSLLGAGTQAAAPPPPPPPPPPSQQAPPPGPLATAMGLGNDPALAAQRAAAQQLPPPPAPQQSPPPSAAGLTLPPGVAPAPPAAPAPQATAPAPGPGPASSTSSAPSGLAGLQEFMAGTTSNPSLQQPPAPQASAAPPAPAQEQPPAGGSYTFEQLAQMGKQ